MHDSWTTGKLRRATFACAHATLPFSVRKARDTQQAGPFAAHWFAHGGAASGPAAAAEPVKPPRRFRFAPVFGKCPRPLAGRGVGSVPATLASHARLGTEPRTPSASVLDLQNFDQLHL